MFDNQGNYLPDDLLNSPEVDGDVAKMIDMLDAANAGATVRSPFMRKNVLTDEIVEDGSFLKLRNLQLGYNLPKSACDKMKMQNWRWFVSAQNVFTIHSAKFTGVDPEVPTFGYPIPLTVTLGTKVTF